MTRYKILLTGMPRTGTSSVRKALEILGYRVRQNPFSDSYVERLWGGDLSPIEHHDVFSEPTIVPLWGEIALRYAPCRVIHTERVTDAWLSSVRRYFAQRVRRPLRAELLLSRLLRAYGGVGTMVDPAIGELCAQMIAGGLDEVSDDRLRYLFDRHNCGTRNLIARYGFRAVEYCALAELAWEPICTLLGHEVPNELFPHENAGA